ncbi:MAG: ABC transporter substrate-binding protein [Betaproteobacteria bacterium]
MASRKSGASRAILLVAVLVVLGAALLVANAIQKRSAVTTIGIMQIIEHPALDAAKKGFVDGLAEEGFTEGKDVKFESESAQGDMATAQSIAQKFVSDKVDMILAIATPTAQAAAKATTTIPILITAVTDPVAAELVKSIDRPGTNVTGTSDLTPVAKQLELLKQLVPTAQRVGIVYNAGETNSVVQVNLARQAAPGLGIELVETTASSTSGVYEAAQSLVGRVDAIYVPTDNTVVSALESVIKVAEDSKIPLVVGEEDGVRRGALATVGIDYYALGKQTAKMAARILRERVKPSEMPIEYQENVRLVINLKAAEKMGVIVPQSLIDQAYEVIQ